MIVHNYSKLQNRALYLFSVEFGYYFFSILFMVAKRFRNVPLVSSDLPKNRRIFLKISALASKKRLNKKYKYFIFFNYLKVISLGAFLI